MKLLILLTLNFIAAITESFFDVKRVKNHLPIRHWQSNLLRVAGWTLAAIVTHYGMLWSQLVVVIALASLYWLTFDYSYNYFFGHRLDYLSSGSNFLDRFLLKISSGKGNRAFAIKLSLFITSLLIYKILL